MILVFYQLIIKQQTAVPLLQIEPAEVVRASDEDEAPQYTQNILEGVMSSGSPRRSWKALLETGMSRVP